MTYLKAKASKYIVRELIEKLLNNPREREEYKECNN